MVGRRKAFPNAFSAGLTVLDGLAAFRGQQHAWPNEVGNIQGTYHTPFADSFFGLAGLTAEQTLAQPVQDDSSIVIAVTRPLELRTKEQVQS